MSSFDRLEEVLKLIAETGDRVIIMGPDHDPFVLMDVDNYRTLLKSAAKKQRLGGLSEAELLDKINQDIAEWRESRAEESGEYELSQFQVDEPRNREDLKRRENTPMQAPGMQNRSVSPEPEVDLPVQSEESSEYHLEPLS